MILLTRIHADIYLVGFLQTPVYDARCLRQEDMTGKMERKTGGNKETRKGGREMEGRKSDDRWVNGRKDEQFDGRPDRWKD